MHKLAAALLALPVLAFVYLSALLHRSIMARVGALAIAIMLVATGLVVGLPEKQVNAKGPTTFPPLTSVTAIQPTIPVGLPLGDPVRVEFSVPMDRASVASNVVVEPAAQLALRWNDAGDAVDISAVPHWEAGRYYTLDVGSAALDATGRPLAQAIHLTFVTARATQGTITASAGVGDRVAPATEFVLTFDRAVKLATVRQALRVEPAIEGNLEGDDPTDGDSHVFRFSPYAHLKTGSSYTVSFAQGGLDAAGLELAPVGSLTVQVLDSPAVVRFRPRDKTVGAEPSTTLSVRFTEAMDTTATAAAFTATADGALVTGTASWAEDDTVLVLKPSSRLPNGSKVVLRVSTEARSATGVRLATEATSSFTVKKAPPTAPATDTKKPSTNTNTTPKKPPVKIPKGSGSLPNSPWHSTEVYYMNLMNCTRTGGWVTSSGGCSSSGHHTLPAQGRLMLDKGISDAVARPYAKYMADRNILTHFARGTPGDRLKRAGYTSYHWGENIGQSGALRMHLYFQSESPCRCDHYKNMMDPQFDRAGVGAWISSGRLRIVIDFYHP